MSNTIEQIAPPYISEVLRENYRILFSNEPMTEDDFIRIIRSTRSEGHGVTLRSHIIHHRNVTIKILNELASDRDSAVSGEAKNALAALQG